MSKLALHGISLGCTKCGAVVEAACCCGASYVPAGDRAAEAVAAHPEMSDRQIAEMIGVGSNTVRRARKSTAPSGAVEKRTGKDGRTRRMPVKTETEPPGVPPAPVLLPTPAGRELGLASRT